MNMMTLICNVINVPKRGIGPKTIEDLRAKAITEGKAFMKL